MPLFKKKTSKPTATPEEKLRPGEDFKHIAFIMDGNGRWAKSRGMPREYGHKVGAATLKKIAIYCSDIGFHAVTVYCFSTENWKRPQHEVDALMILLDHYLDDMKHNHKDYNCHFRFLGDLSVLTPALREKIAEVEALNLHIPHVLNMAVNYGGRAEIAHACNTLMAEGKTSVTEEDLSRVMYTAESGDPDMIVRTGGDLRISNFLLWQSAYAELYFMEKFWPDLTYDDIDDIVKVFYSRKRRFGGL